MSYMTPREENSKIMHSLYRPYSRGNSFQATVLPQITLPRALRGGFRAGWTKFASQPKALVKRIRKKLQLAASKPCPETCVGWANGHASTHKSPKKKTFQDRLLENLADITNGRFDMGCMAKHVDLRANLMSTKVSASQRKCAQGLA